MTKELLVVTIVGLSAGCSRPAESTDRSAATPSVGGVAASGRWVEGSFANAVGSRQYRLYVPGGYDANHRPMLVVLLHGCTQDAADFARGTRIAEHAERNRFLALLPEQPESAHPKKCWNWYEPAHQGRGSGEPSLIAAMTGRVVDEYAADRARVHLAGISAGAAMAALVAVAYPDQFASIALHSGLAWRSATDVSTALGAMAGGVADPDSLGVAAFKAMGARARPVPTLVLHGGKDVVLNPLNGRQGARQWTVTNARAIGVQLRAADETSAETGGYTWTQTCHRDEAGVCSVEEWVVNELGHAWSGGSRDGTFTDERGPDATREIVRFFREHPMVAPR